MSMCLIWDHYNLNILPDFSRRATLQLHCIAVSPSHHSPPCCTVSAETKTQNHLFAAERLTVDKWAANLQLQLQTAKIIPVCVTLCLVLWLLLYVWQCVLSSALNMVLPTSYKFCSISSYWCRIHLWFRLMGVCKQSRWRHSVTEPSQDGGYAFLWQRYDNNKMVAMRYYGNVMTTTMSQHSDDVFYIFNSTVIDWTFYLYIIDLWCTETQI